MINEEYENEEYENEEYENEEYEKENLYMINEEYQNEDGWIISSDDDIYDEVYGDTFPDKENIDEDIDLTSPFSIVISTLKYQPQNETNGPLVRNADGTDYKPRPAALVIKTADNTGYRCFQITSTPPHGGFSNYRFRLDNPINQYGLELDPSYLNYEHFCYTKPKFIHCYLHTSLSERDCKKLYDAIRMNFNTLITQNKFQKRDYIQLKKLLEGYLGIDTEDE